jgi:hypothetical protein
MSWCPLVRVRGRVRVRVRGRVGVFSFSDVFYAHEYMCEPAATIEIDISNM